MADPQKTDQRTIDLADHTHPFSYSTPATSRFRVSGDQFTTEAFTGVLQAHDVRISMDGSDRALDNIFVKRLWCTLMYEVRGVLIGLSHLPTTSSLLSN